MGERSCAVAEGAGEAFAPTSDGVAVTTSSLGFEFAAAVCGFAAEGAGIGLAVESVPVESESDVPAPAVTGDDPTASFDVVVFGGGGETEAAVTAIPASLSAVMSVCAAACRTGAPTVSPTVAWSGALSPVTGFVVAVDTSAIPGPDTGLLTVTGVDGGVEASFSGARLVCCGTAVGSGAVVAAMAAAAIASGAPTPPDGALAEGGSVAIMPTEIATATALAVGACSSCWGKASASVALVASAEGFSFAVLSSDVADLGRGRCTGARSSFAP